MYIDNPDTIPAVDEPRRSKLPLIGAIAIAVFVLATPLTAMAASPVVTFFGIFGAAWLYLGVYRGERIWTPMEYLREHAATFVHPNRVVRILFIALLGIAITATLVQLWTQGALYAASFTVIGVAVSSVQLVWAGYSLAALRAAIERAEQEKLIRGLRNLLIGCGVRRSTVAGLDISVDDITFTIDSPPAEMLNSVLAERVDRSLREVHCAVEAWDDRSIRVVAVIPETPGEGLEIPEEDGAAAGAVPVASGVPGVIDLSSERW